MATLSSNRPAKKKKQEQVETSVHTLQDSLQSFGVPEHELTPAVRFAMSALIEQLEDMTQELDSLRETLSDVSQQVDIDCLAPIPNRRAFMQHLNWAVAMLERYKHPSAVLFIDLNDFKRINDHYGHAAGDAAIRHVAETLAGMMRESDFVGRIGGDEFGIVMYHAEYESAERRGREIGKKLTSTPFAVGNHELTISAAFGCYVIQPGDTAETALSAADKAMYEHKRKEKETTTATAE